MVDNASGSKGFLSGELAKAKFILYKRFTDGGVVEGKDEELEFMFNPASLSTSQEVKLVKEERNQDKQELQFANSTPICLTIPEIWFDTYESRESVRDHIAVLEKALVYEKETHVIPVITFVWGEFAKEAQAEFVFFLTKLDVEYTMFLPSGRPVRAKVKVSLEQVPWFQKDKQSPDHAKLYTVRRGDTLQSIAYAEYDDPGEWRRIARLNNISDPLDVSPGTRLLVPPILK